MKAMHIIGIVAACILAVSPILLPSLPHSVAAVAPAVLAVAAILKHADDTVEKPPVQS